MFALLMSIFVWTKLTIHAWFCFWTLLLMHVTGPRAMYFLKQKKSVSEEPKSKIMIENPVARKS